MSDSVTFKAKIDDTITDRNTGASGVVKAQSNSRHDLRGYWIEGLDNTGRPFETYVDERDALGADGKPLA